MTISKFSTKKVFVSLSGAVLGGLIIISGAYAANPEPVVVEVEFVEPIAITEVSPLQYGLLNANLAGGDTVRIDPDGLVTDSVAGLSIVEAVAPAAELTVAATGGQVITIDVGNVSNGTGYTLGAFMCNYAAGGDAACDGGAFAPTADASGSASLFVGATLTGNGAAAAGLANGSFDVTISYQ